jgi:prepilin-type N-terminal cleavage/methylation domain-containing protein
MKTIKSVECRVSNVESQAAGAVSSCPPSPVTRYIPAFTLVEVLVVMAIIAVIAALILPVAGQVKRQAFLHTAQAEMSQIETAVERYHSAYGFYPPDNHLNPANPMINQLYYELVGMTNNGTSYVTLDGVAKIAATDVTNAFGVSGFMNCNKPGADESAPHAQNFLPGLKPSQFNQNITNNNVQVTLLVTSDGGPDPNYQPLNALGVNPWRYVSSNPTNNPGSYDLWVQLKIAGKTNLICNWSSQVQINNPLP